MSQSIDETRILDERSDYSGNDEESMEELSGCGALAICNPNTYLHRLIALILMCLVGFASNFAYDNPSSLEDNFKHDLNLTTTEFGMLYSVYSWPNVILCFIGGFLIDRVFGIRWGTNIYTFIAMAGQILFGVGALVKDFWVMMLGRFLFGIGSENMQVAQNYYAVLWFKGKELNTAFGAQNAVSNLGAIMNFVIMEPFYKFLQNYYEQEYVIGMVLFVTSLVAVISMISSLILGWMDKRAKRILRRNDNPSGEIAKFSDIKTFGLIFWMLNLVYVSYNLAVTPFVSLANRFFELEFKYSAEEADRLIAIVPLLSAVTGPFFGWIVDKTGQNVTWVFVSTIVTMGAHAMLAFCDVNPYINIIAIGLANSMLFTGVNELVAIIVPEHQLGTAFGIVQAVQNLGLAIVAMLEGVIVDNGGFIVLELFFIGWLSVTTLAIAVIWFKDYIHGGYLNMTPSFRESFLKALSEGSSTISESSGFANSIENIDIIR